MELLRAGKYCLQGAATLSLDMSRVSTNLGVYCLFNDQLLPADVISGRLLLTKELQENRRISCTLFHPGTVCIAARLPITVGKLDFKAGTAVNISKAPEHESCITWSGLCGSWFEIRVLGCIEAIEILQYADCATWDTRGKECFDEGFSDGFGCSNSVAS